MFLISACGNSVDDSGEYLNSQYKDDEMIGTVWEVNEDRIVVDISEWKKRDRKENTTDEGYSYIAKITEETDINHEDGTEASIDAIKQGQKVMVNPPEENDFEGHPDEIILLEMSDEEKYSRLLSHIDGFNIVVMYEFGETVPMEMQDSMYGDVLNILEGTEHKAVAAWVEYNADYIVDYKKEFGIEQFPAILVFNKEEILFKTYQVDELYDYFRNLKE